MTEQNNDTLNRWKVYFVGAILVLMCICFPLFVIPGYLALYWAWICRNLPRALPYLPMARSFGMLAVFASALAFGVLCLPRIFPLSPRIRLWLSFVAALNLGFFGELRNEGKFWLKGEIHFFGPGTWAREELDTFSLGLGNFIYTLEFSHLNDFLMGPVIVSVLFGFVFWRIRAAVFNPSASFSLTTSKNEGVELEQALRFGRIIMYVGLAWFFAQAWCEEAGYVRSSHLPDEIDLTAELTGALLGLWMARYLTRPFGNREERFWSTLPADLFASGIVGLAYTLVVGFLTEGIERGVAYALFPKVAPMFEYSGFTSVHQRLRPLELLLLLGVVAWAFNRTVGQGAEQFAEDTKSSLVDFDLQVISTVVKGLGVTVLCLAFWGVAIAFIRMNGFDWPIMGAAIPIMFGLGALLVARQQRAVVLFRGGE